MRVAGITADGDWTFGSGKASYKVEADAIKQNVATRLRSFTNDWFLDVENGIDWFALLGSRNSLDKLERAVQKSVLQTTGVVSISNFDVVEDRKNRAITINLSYTDVFGELISEGIDVSL